jgi:hypothetical protein
VVDQNEAKEMKRIPLNLLISRYKKTKEQEKRIERKREQREAAVLYKHLYKPYFQLVSKILQILLISFRFC